MKTRFCLLLWLCLGVSWVGYSQQPYENEIIAFEKQDAATPPIKGQVMLYGSSTLRLWATYQADLRGYGVVNRGFGGSQMEHAVAYFERVVVPHQPAWLLVYEGDNDLSAGKTPERVMTDFKELVRLVKAKSPQTKVAIYTVKPSVARENLLPQQQQLNALFRQYARKNRRRVYYLDTFTPLLSTEGKPRLDLVIADKLHLNAAGYAIWTKATREFLEKQVKK